MVTANGKLIILEPGFPLDTESYQKLFPDVQILSVPDVLVFDTLKVYQSNTSLVTPNTLYSMSIVLLLGVHVDGNISWLVLVLLLWLLTVPY